MAASAWAGPPLSQTKAPPNFLSVLWTGMVSGDLSKFLVVNSKLCVELRQIDLCKRIKKELLERQRKCVSWQRLCFRSAIRSTLRLDSVSFNICCVCVCSLCTTPCDYASPQQCPPKPSFPVWSQLNWIKDMARSLPGGQFRPKSRSASICMYQKSKW